MRTATFLGLLILAKAIRPDVHENTASELAVMVVIMIIMDVIDFIKNLTKE